ncbi:MAG: ATP-dependent helicase [Chloroflexi bacterium]|nr:ATP-dependent helicase [Chloroflexota bacterium]
MGSRDIGLTAVQRQVVEAPAARRVFIGGPGAGKSLVVGERAVWLLASGVARPEHVLLLAPSRRAANALAEHVRRRLGSGLLPIATTFHGLAAGILRRHYRELGYQRRPEILDTASHFHLLRQMLAAEDPSRWPHYGASLDTLALRNTAHDLIIGAAENGLSVEELYRRTERAHRPDFAELIEFYARYRRRQRETGEIDFGALLVAVGRLLSDNPAVATTWRQAHRHILVDEFEAASHAQAGILCHLVGEGTDLLIAGDPDQAIDGYRGGSAAHLLACPERLDAGVVASSENLRSAGKLGALVEVVRKAMHTDWGEQPFAPTIDWSATQGYVEASCQEEHPGREGVAGTLHTTSTQQPSFHSGRVVLRSFATPAEEARWLAAEVESLVRARLAPRQIAVLLRTLSAAQPVIRELALRGIDHDAPERGVRGDTLVRAALGLLRYLTEGDVKSLSQLLSSPLSGLPPFGLWQLRRAAARAALDPTSLLAQEVDLDALALDADVRAAIAALRARLATLRAEADRGASRLLWEVWRLFPALHADALGDGAGSRAIAVLLAAVLQLEERRGSLDLRELLGLWDDGYFDHLSDSASSPGVAIATVQQAKGQQWEVVFLPGLVEGDFPLQASPTDVVGTLLAQDLLASSDAGRVAEEARAFYVAMSRACARLYLSYSRRRADGSTAGLRSRFVTMASGCPGVDVMPEDDASLPTDIGGAVLRYRRMLASPDRLAQTQAVYALHKMRQLWPEAVRPEDWWSNIRETEGAAPAFPEGRLRLSATQLGSYRECPLAYQFGHYWRLAGPKGPPLVIGGVVHQVLQEYHRPASPLPRTRAALEELLERYLAPANFRYRPIARQARRSIEEMLDAYFGRYGESGPAVDVEKGFRFACGPHAITGYIDRIDRLPSGEVEILDYKTGASPMAKAEAEADLQLAMYDLAFYGDRDLQELGRPAKVSYLYLKSIGPRADGKRSYAPTAAGRAALEAKVAYYADGIMAERFPSRFAIAQAFADLDPVELDAILRKDPCRLCAFGWLCPENENHGGTETRR